MMNSRRIRVQEIKTLRIQGKCCNIEEGPQIHILMPIQMIQRRTIK